VLRFGEFTTKAGRLSPYFFNAGLFNDGAALDRLAEFYANGDHRQWDPLRRFVRSGLQGHSAGGGDCRRPGAAGRNLPFSFNRKEAKDHGEGRQHRRRATGRSVLIVDDVISAGTSVRESVELIRAAGATPCGVVIALDRMERGQGALSAVQEVERDYDMPVIAVATLDDLLAFLGMTVRICGRTRRRSNAIGRNMALRAAASLRLLMALVLARTVAFGRRADLLLPRRVGQAGLR
jgi:orotate phosphoribosyltransferase